MAEQRITLVVPAAITPVIQDFCRRVGRGFADGMLTTALSPTGQAPATHYVSSGFIKQAFIDVMQSPVQLFNVAKKEWALDGEVFPYTQAQVTNRLSQCTLVVGESEAPLAVLARLGLARILEEQA